ncbi:uncharacterized protein [Asterias amurensis]|uniref:uncharacterized protein n=1 Tax=Asterias amurensis TaxID=7602 RepID=UPI003AB7FB5B
MTFSNDTQYIVRNPREAKLREVVSYGHAIKVTFWAEGADWSAGSGSKVNARFSLKLLQVAADYSLQSNCNNITARFLCDSGDACVDRAGRCDAVLDCPDQSDERNCGHLCPLKERCNNGTTCLQRRFHCDSIIDCPNGEDEQLCDLRLCPWGCTCKMNSILYIPMMQVNCTSHPDAFDALRKLPRRTNGIKMRRDLITDLEPGSFDALPNLIILDVEQNHITRLKHGVFRHLKLLTILKLNMNELVTIDAGVFEPLTSLVQVLRLDSNRLVEINEDMFRGLAKLRYLRLANNEIQTLKSNTFRHLSSLLSLDLVHNRITSIEPGAFAGLDNLKALHISDNLLTVFQPNVFTGLHSVRHLDIGDNPWTVIKPGAFNGLDSLELLVLKRRSNETVDFIVNKHELEHMTHLTSVLVDDSKLCCLLDTKTIGIDICVPDNEFHTEIPYLSCNRIMHSSVLRVFVWCLGFSALIGNAGIIVWRLNMKDSGKRSQSVLILNLAVSDLIMGVYMLIVGGADVHYQDDYFLHANDWKSSPICKFAGFLSMLSSEASVFFITMISIDRFLCVVFPFGKKWFRLESARVATLVMWCIALAISLPPVFLQDLLDGKNHTFYGLYDICVGLPLVIKPRTGSSNKTLLEVTLLNQTVTQKAGPSWIFSATVYLGINFACCLVVIVCYSAIAFVVIIKLPAKKLHARKDREHRRREMTMATRMLLIVGTDFCCWMPVIIMGILSQSGAVDIPDETYAWVVVFVIPINSAINPYLYTVSNANSVTLKCCKCRKPGLIDAVRLKPMNSLQTKDTQSNRRSRSGTNNNL